MVMRIRTCKVCRFDNVVSSPILSVADDVEVPGCCEDDLVTPGCHMFHVRLPRIKLTGQAVRRILPYNHKRVFADLQWMLYFYRRPLRGQTTAKFPEMFHECSA